MSQILALDSATDACSVALYRHGEITSLFEYAAKSHTQRLLPMVDELLKTAGCRVSDLDAIAFGRGPGSFTGLRICMGVVQGLAFGAKLPVIPVSTLAAMAAGYQRAHPDNHLPLLPALDARMDEIYWALFAFIKDVAEPEQWVAEQVSAPDVIARCERVVGLQGQYVALGSGWQYPQLGHNLPARIDREWLPQAEDILRIAVEQFERGECQSILDAELIYLRDTVSWQKRERIRGGA